eukprot:13130612-Ditylum_brightwellii.AAC.1
MNLNCYFNKSLVPLYLHVDHPKGGQHVMMISMVLTMMVNGTHLDCGESDEDYVESDCYSGDEKEMTEEGSCTDIKNDSIQ